MFLNMMQCSWGEIVSCASVFKIGTQCFHRFTSVSGCVSVSLFANYSVTKYLKDVISCLPSESSWEKTTSHWQKSLFCLAKQQFSKKLSISGSFLQLAVVFQSSKRLPSLATGQNSKVGICPEVRQVIEGQVIDVSITNLVQTQVLETGSVMACNETGPILTGGHSHLQFSSYNLENNNNSLLTNCLGQTIIVKRRHYVTLITACLSNHQTSATQVVQHFNNWETLYYIQNS